MVWMVRQQNKTRTSSYDPDCNLGRKTVDSKWDAAHQAVWTAVLSTHRFTYSHGMLSSWRMADELSLLGSSAANPFHRLVSVTCWVYFFFFSLYINSHVQSLHACISWNNNSGRNESSCNLLDVVTRGQQWECVQWRRWNKVTKIVLYYLED